jgi:hypothetical protein
MTPSALMLCARLGVFNDVVFWQSLRRNVKLKLEPVWVNQETVDIRTAWLNVTYDCCTCVEPGSTMFPTVTTFGLVSGHDFSRAAQNPKQIWALAPACGLDFGSGDNFTGRGKALFCIRARL